MYQPYLIRTATTPEDRDHKARGYTTWKTPCDNRTCMQLTWPPPVRIEVVMCNCVRNPGGHADPNPVFTEGFLYISAVARFDHGVAWMESMDSNCSCDVCVNEQHCMFICTAFS